MNDTSLPRALATARLEEWFRAAVAAVQPHRALAAVFEGEGDSLSIAGDRVSPGTRLVAVAIGKAACAMARELELRAGPRIRAGLAVTKDGHTLPLERFQIRLAGHPVPDARSAAAAREALALAGGCASEERLVVLLSGGASALTALPAPGLSVSDLVQTGDWLLACGADIEAVNGVRKHLGAFGGGQLAAASTAARIDLLAISDVPGDRLDVIGSGPCSADPSTFEDALSVVRQRDGWSVLPEAVVERLRRGARGEIEETLQPGSPPFERVHAAVIACNADARQAACAAARADGWTPVDAGAVLVGEAREVGARLLSDARRQTSSAARTAWIAGGETTVTLRGDGLGGRNQECALAAALAGAGTDGWSLLAAGTDGGDGPTDAAGARADGETVERGRNAGVDARSALAANDSHRFFCAEGGVLRTGPTHTNVMDLALVAFEAAGRGAEAPR